jgi:hypothetical protein
MTTHSVEHSLTPSIYPVRTPVTASVCVNPRNSAGQPYFNPNYFMQEPLGQVGNAMRRYFVGPGIYNFDLALLKGTKITESMQAQFRAEAFNVFNHPQLNNPTGNFNDSEFGVVTSAQPERIMQLALKFLF